MEFAYRTKRCETCGNEYQPMSGRQKQCISCKTLATAKCVNCGRFFRPTPNTTGRYCSAACSNAFVTKPEYAVRDCAVCGKQFKPKRVGQQACSRECSGSLRRRPPRICPGCGKTFISVSSRQVTCSRACRGAVRREPRNEMCKACGKPLPFNRYRGKIYCSPACRSGPIGTRKNTTGGYVLIKAGKGYPGADHRGYLMEHRYVMQEHLGRPLLATESVHHKDGDRHNNRLENLELWADRQQLRGQRSVDMLIHDLAKLTPEDRRRVLEHFKE
jgi:hypothetical protein